MGALEPWHIMVLMLVIAAVVVPLLIVLGVVMRVARPKPTPTAPSAREVLDRRLAAGEISVQEWHERVRLLDADPSGPPDRCP